MEHGRSGEVVDAFYNGVRLKRLPSTISLVTDSDGLQRIDLLNDAVVVSDE